MSELAKYRKADLQTLAEEFGVDILATDRIIDIIGKIEKSPGYDEAIAIPQIKLISEERKLEKERQEREAEREYELERLRLTTPAAETASLSSDRAVQRTSISLKSVMQKFDPEKSDMALFLTLFQRQAKKLNLEDDELVTQLLSLLPVDIAELILREPPERLDDFEYIRTKLLHRFKLNPEAYRVKFVQHQRRSGALWKDLIFELQSYLEGWLEGLEITSFEKLKKLMITDQLKRRASFEMKENLIDSWSKFVEPEVLAEKLDEYESVRKPIKKQWTPKSFEQKGDKIRTEKKHGEAKKSNWRENPHDKKDREKIFEKRKTFACYHCNSPDHLRYNCPELKKQNAERVNNLGMRSGFPASFEPYLSTAWVNGKEATVLRDTGTTFDLVPQKLVNPENFNGEVIWLKQPLENEFRCLPVANIELHLENLGILKTKAAVVNSEVHMEHYLLGNQTGELIKEREKHPHFVNMVQTRRRNVNKTPSPQKEEASLSEENLSQPETADERITLPVVQRDQIGELVGVNTGQFMTEQRKDGTLEALWKKAQEKRDSGYEVENEMLFRKVRDHRQMERKQLCIPLAFRTKILQLCHEGVASHLGATKTKDKILRYFFWPNCIKDAEEFVRSCDSCQRVGKAGERKKAPLKLVPIITEIFSRINFDITGPLPTSENNNRYLLTAMCLASKYPEAIPITDTKSDSVINALLIVFSRTGFPKEVQCDLGTCFTSHLTTAFFEKFGIKVVHSSVHHPQSHPIERWHRSVKRLLKVLCVENGTNWERNLPYALLALRTVTHESTGFSPAELVHGKNLRTPETLLFEHWTKPNEEESLVTEYVFELINRLKRCQELAAETMENAREKRKLWYDKNAIDRKFKPGDKVLVVATSKPNKLSVSWVGPGEIEKQISDTNYIVKMPGKREKSQLFHVNLLKPYYRRVEMVNILIDENFDASMKDADLEIPYPNAEPEVYDFNEIVRESELNERCTPDQIVQLKILLDQHKDLFSNDPGRTHLIEHDIELISNQPVRLKPYRTSPRQTEILKAEIKRMLELKIIEEGESDYTSPMILVEAPGRDPRPCIDYRKLNSITRVEFFPLPNIEERVELVAAAKYITVIDLTKGYWQIPLTPRAQRIAAFVTNFGCYRPLTLPFGVVGGPYRFSKFMDLLLKGCEKFCVPYLDDTAIFSETWDDHLKHLDVVLRKISEANLKIKPSKCRFAQNSVKYLGHMVGGGSRTPAEAKIQAVADFPAPQTKTQIRRFLGMAGYYCRYIQDYATIVEPLTKALKGKNRKGKVEWTSEMNDAFSRLKEKLTEKPVLYAPDYADEFIIQTDASDKGIGVVMSQRKNKEEHPVLYLSRKFTEPEKRYSTTEKECAGIIFAIKKLRHYLDGQKFVIETDHNPLVWLKTNAGNNPRLMRWALALQPFNYTVVHRPGKDIKHADCLSRIEE